MADGPFDRRGSTLGVMDDLQVAVHTYDGCPRGCPGCVVDREFKNRRRFRPLIPRGDMAIVQGRVAEYYAWVRDTLNAKEGGYFGRDRHQVCHYSFTMRFGNHAELPLDDLVGIAESLAADFRVFSTGPVEDLGVFVELNRRVPGRLFLEIIYDPLVDRAGDLRAMIEEMRRHGILGYPEVLLTRRLLASYAPERFVEEHVAPLGDLGAQMQLGRYVPSMTRGFDNSQVVPLDQEVDWLAAVARAIVAGGHDVHPIPLGEYAVTLLDEYAESAALGPDGRIDETRLPPPEPFDAAAVRDKVRDIMLTSLYVDHKLDLYLWAESMGQHVLDGNLGFEPLGNIRDHGIRDILTGPGNRVERLLSDVLRDLVTNPRCAPCRYKSFCASHAVPLFRQGHADNGRHCYGYLPVIREFQRSPAFLQRMVSGFRELGF